MSKDPGEEKDISGGNEIRTMGMKAMLANWRNTLGAQENTGSVKKVKRRIKTGVGVYHFVSKE